MNDLFYLENRETHYEHEQQQHSHSNLNKHLTALEEDYLYHISLGKKTNDLKKMFGDVKVSAAFTF